MWIPSWVSFWAADQNLYRAIHIGLHREFLDRLMLLVTYTGDGHIQIPVLLGLLAWPKTRRAGYALAAGYLLSGGLRLLVKDWVSRPRPTNFEWSRPLTWPGGLPGGPGGWLSRTFDVVPFGDSSFPSGHSTTSFAIAFMAAWLVYKSENGWIGWAACLWASLVGFSRVYVGVHYPGDVVGGAALAGLCTSAVYLLWVNRGWLPEAAGRQPSQEPDGAQ